MSYDSMYWLILGTGFVLTGLTGVGIMVKTGKLGLSFIAGTVVNAAIHVGAIVWWASIFASPEQQFSRMFGIFGLGVCLVNNEVLLFFAQLIMKRRLGGAAATQLDLQGASAGNGEDVT